MGRGAGRELLRVHRGGGGHESPVRQQRAYHSNATMLSHREVESMCNRVTGLIMTFYNTVLRRPSYTRDTWLEAA